MLFALQAFDDLLLLKRGGQVTYMGPLGSHSTTLVNYFEVRMSPPDKLASSAFQHPTMTVAEKDTTSAGDHLGPQLDALRLQVVSTSVPDRIFLQGIENVPRLTPGLNPPSWMLEISTIGREEEIGVDFAEVFLASDLFRQVSLPLPLYFVAITFDSYHLL